MKWSIGHSITKQVFPIHYFMANLLPKQRMLKTVTFANISHHLTSSKKLLQQSLADQAMACQAAICVNVFVCLPTIEFILPGFIKVGLVILTVNQVPYQISKGFVVLASHLQYNNIIIQNKFMCVCVGGGRGFSAGFCKIKFHWINFLSQLTEFKCVSFCISMVSDSLSEYITAEVACSCKLMA